MPIVRRAKPADAERLSALRYHFRSGEDTVVESREEFLARCRSWMRERLDPAKERWRCWVAEVTPRIVGHVWIQIVPKVPNPAEEAEAHAYLTNTYVEPAYRNEEIGTTLIDTAVGWCRSESIDSLILWPTKRSRPLYRRCGFDPAEDMLSLTVSGRR